MADPRSTSPPPDSTAEVPDEVRAGQDRFIAIWGEMGQSWGIPRTMAEIHALLFIAGEAMNTDEVMERLKISRGSASTSLRALVDWGVVSRAHIPGDRKEYFRAEQDVWRMFRMILRERKRREIDPLLVALHECRDMTRAEVAPNDPASKEHNRRLDDMLEFVEIADSLANRFISPSGKGLRLAAGILGKVV
ncbi:MAG: GbsR/MarR family transcriptional regulator [Phycisphaerales bacterium]